MYSNLVFNEWNFPNLFTKTEVTARNPQSWETVLKITPNNIFQASFIVTIL